MIEHTLTAPNGMVLKTTDNKLVEALMLADAKTIEVANLNWVEMKPVAEYGGYLRPSLGEEFNGKKFQEFKFAKGDVVEFMLHDESLWRKGYAIMCKGGGDYDAYRLVVKERLDGWLDFTGKEVPLGVKNNERVDVLYITGTNLNCINAGSVVWGNVTRYRKSYG